VSAIHRVAKNTAVLLVSQILSFTLGFLYLTYSARYLGPENFGILSFAISFTTIFGIFADLGLSQLTVRDLSRDHILSQKYLGNIIVIKIVSSIIIFLLVFLIINLINQSSTTTIVVYIMAICVLTNSLSQIFYSIFQSYERMEYQAIGTILTSIFLLSMALLAIYFKLDLVFFALIYLIVSIILLIYNITICLWKFISPKIELDVNFWKLILSESIFFVLASVFTEIYFNIDSVMLSLMIGNEAVGFYNAAYRLIFILLFIPTVLIISIFPLMSKHFESAKNILKMEYEKIFRYLFILALPIFIFGVLFADKIIIIIYGSNYTASIGALQILICVIPVIFITYLFGNLLGAINKQRLVAIITGASAIFNVILNILLIPKFSFFGASLATVLTEICVFIIMFSYISKFFHKISITNNVLKPLIGASILAILILIFNYINWILAFVLGIIIYIPILYMLNIVGNEDIKLIRELVKKRY